MKVLGYKVFDSNEAFGMWQMEQWINEIEIVTVTPFASGISAGLEMGQGEQQREGEIQGVYDIKVFVTYWYELGGQRAAKAVGDDRS